MDQHQLLPRLHSREEINFSTGMPYEGLEIKLDSDHLEVALYMPPLIISSFRDARKHEVTQLLLDSSLQHTEMGTLKGDAAPVGMSRIRFAPSHQLSPDIHAQKFRKRMEAISQILLDTRGTAQRHGVPIGSRLESALIRMTFV